MYSSFSSLLPRPWTFCVIILAQDGLWPWALSKGQTRRCGYVSLADLHGCYYLCSCHQLGLGKVHWRWRLWWFGSSYSLICSLKSIIGVGEVTLGIEFVGVSNGLP